VSEVVDANTVVYPRTMTGLIVSATAPIQLLTTAHLLIMPRNASSTPFAMLTPYSHPIHANVTEILIVKLPKPKKLIDDGLLLASTTQLRHVSRIFDHTVDVEVQGETVRDTKTEIQEEMLWIRIYQT